MYRGKHNSRGDRQRFIDGKWLKCINPRLLAVETGRLVRRPAGQHRWKALVSRNAVQVADITTNIKTYTQMQRCA